jgi:hypothetical protein
MINREVYQNPLNERYSSKEMSYIFQMKINLKHGENYGLHLLRAKKN